MPPGGTPMNENDIGSHADRTVCGKRGLLKPTKNPRLAKCAHLGYPNHIFRRAAHELFKFTTSDENTPDSPFEGGEGVVSVPDWTVLSTKRQPPDS